MFGCWMFDLLMSPVAFCDLGVKWCHCHAFQQCCTAMHCCSAWQSVLDVCWLCRKLCVVLYVGLRRTGCVILLANACSEGLNYFTMLVKYMLLIPTSTPTY